MTNQEKLENEAVLPSGVNLTTEQQEAIDSLSPEEVEALVSVKKKLGGAFTTDLGQSFIIMHHIAED